MGYAVTNAVMIPNLLSARLAIPSRSPVSYKNNYNQFSIPQTDGADRQFTDWARSVSLVIDPFTRFLMVSVAYLLTGRCLLLHLLLIHLADVLLEMLLLKLSDKRLLLQKKPFILLYYGSRASSDKLT